MTVTLDGTTIILALIGAVVTVLTAYIAATTRQVHKAVNTNYQAMLRDLEVVNAQLATLTTLTATQAETIRGADVARALAQGPGAATPAVQPVEIVSPAPVPVVVEGPTPPPPPPDRGGPLP